jgi:hypothetical protein
MADLSYILALSGNRPSRAQFRASFRANTQAMSTLGLSNGAWQWLRRIHRERRRLAFVSLMAFLAGYLLYRGIPGQAFGLPVPVFTGLFYAAFVGTAAIATTLLLPRLRFTLEMVAISRVIFAVMVSMFPELLRPVLDDPFQNATTIILGAAAVHWVISSGMMDRFFAARALVMEFDASGRALDGPQTVNLACKTQLAHAPGGRRSNLISSPYDVGFVPTADTLRVRVNLKDLPLPTVALYWLDDAAGRIADQFGVR